MNDVVIIVVVIWTSCTAFICVYRFAFLPRLLIYFEFLWEFNKPKFDAS